MEKIKDDIIGKMTLEDVDELDYVKMCYQESMRCHAPAPMSSTSMVNRDVTISGLNMRKGDPFYLIIHNMQRDPR